MQAGSIKSGYINEAVNTTQARATKRGKHSFHAKSQKGEGESHTPNRTNGYSQLAFQCNRRTPGARAPKTYGTRKSCLIEMYTYVLAFCQIESVN